MAFAREKPGRLTYPAPPDSTGSAFDRQVVDAMSEDEAMAWLDELPPLLWEQGRTHPGSEAELNQLFANNEVEDLLDEPLSAVDPARREDLAWALPGSPDRLEAA